MADSGFKTGSECVGKKKKEQTNITKRQKTTDLKNLKRLLFFKYLYSHIE